MHLTSENAAQEERRLKCIELLRDATKISPVALLIVSMEDGGGVTVRCAGSLIELCYLVKSSETFLAELMHGRVR